MSLNSGNFNECSLELHFLIFRCCSFQMNQNCSGKPQIPCFHSRRGTSVVPNDHRRAFCTAVPRDHASVKRYTVNDVTCFCSRRLVPSFLLCKLHIDWFSQEHTVQFTTSYCAKPTLLTRRDSRSFRTVHVNANLLLSGFTACERFAKGNTLNSPACK